MTRMAIPATRGNELAGYHSLPTESTLTDREKAAAYLERRIEDDAARSLLLAILGLDT